MAADTDVSTTDTADQVDRPLAGYATFERRRIVLSEAGTELVRKKTLSPSTADAVSSCGGRFVVERLLERLAPSPKDPLGAAELGTATHQVFEDLFAKPKGERGLAAAAQLLERLALDHPELHAPSDPELLAQWRSEVQTRVVGLWEVERPDEIDVIGRELHVTVDLDGVPFNGYIDRVRRVDDGVSITDYKGLALDTPIPTPHGWTTMRDLDVGAFVFGADGEPVLVTAKSEVHDRPCYKITFLDGETVTCDNVHQWLVRVARPRRQPEETLVDTPELARLFEEMASAGRPRSLSIHTTAPLALPEADLPIDPWVLGAWLGDGHTKSGSITVGRQDRSDMLTLLKERWGDVHEPDWASRLERKTEVCLGRPISERCERGHDDWIEIYGDGRNHHTCRTCINLRQSSWAHGCSPEGGAPTCGNYPSWGARCPQKQRVPLPPRWNLALSTLLEANGLLRNKHIPSAYLRASIIQRLDLLRGLMDTDGYWNPTRHQAVFVNTNRHLVDGVVELIRSLGWKPYVFAPRRSKEQHAQAWMVIFTPVDMNPFLLPRKAMLVAEWMASKRSTVKATHRIIASIQRVDTVPTQCITVESESSLFLCGRGMIPTHNCGAGKIKKESARYGDAHGDQIRLYARAVAAKHPELGPVTAGEVLYVYHRKRRDVDMSQAAMDGTRARYEKSWKLLSDQTEAGAFGLKTSPLCGWCPAVQVCPAALAANKVPRTESAEHGALLGIALADGLTLPVPSVAVAGTPVPAGTSGGAFDVRANDPSAFAEQTYDPAVDFADASTSRDVRDGAPPPGGQGSSDARAGAAGAGVEPVPPSMTPEPSTSGPVTGSAATADGDDTTVTDDKTATPPQTSKESRLMYDELKPWAETNSDGTLNLNSYAATAAFGTVALAVETLHSAEQKITPKAVDAFAETLALIVQRCQESLDVRPSMQDGSHTRLRGALRTSIDTMPAPFGEDSDAWAAWVRKTEKRVLSIHAAALRLWSTGGQEAEPWAALAVAKLEAA